MSIVCLKKIGIREDRVYSITSTFEVANSI